MAQTKTIKRNWVVAQTHPCREEYAAKNVRRQNHIPYLPQYFDLKQMRRRPVFPSYLFVHAPDRRVAYLRSTLGISRVIMACDTPLMLPDHVISDLRKRENANGVIPIDGEVVRKPKRPYFHHGEEIRLNHGPMARDDVHAKFDCMTGKERVRILLSWLGQSIPATVSISQIEKIT